MSPEQMQTIKLWLQAKANAKHWAEQERLMREAIVRDHFGGKGDGTFRAPIENGYGLKLVNTTKYTVEAGDTLNRAALACRELPAYKDAPEKLFRWKPELVMKVWKEQPGEVVALFNPALTSRPQAPQLELEEPPK